MSNEEPYRPPPESPTKIREQVSSRTSIVRGTNFGCLYVVLGTMAVGLCVGFLAPLFVDIQEGKQEDFAAAMGKLFVIFGALPLWIVGFVRHRRMRR